MVTSDVIQFFSMSSSY